MKNRRAELALLAAMVGLYFFSYFQRVAVPSSIFNEIQSEFGVPASSVTALSSIYLYVYASLQLFIGIIVDRYGAAKVILIFGAFMVAGAMMFPLAGAISILYLSRALIGFGSSAMYLCVVKEADRLFDAKNFSLAFGTICIIAYSGGLFGTSPFRKMVECLGWQTPLIIVAVANIAVLVGAFAAWRIAKPEAPRVRLSAMGSLGTVIRNKFSYPIFIALPLIFAVYFVIQATIGAKFLQDVKGMSAIDSTKCTFVMMLVNMSMIFISGLLSRLVGNRRKPFLIGACLLNITALLIMSFASMIKGPGWLFVASFVMMSLASGCVTVGVAALKELTSQGTLVLSIGVQNTIAYVCVAVFANLTGFILELFRSSATVSAGSVIYPVSAYLTLFAVLGIFSIVALISTFYLRETRGQSISGVV